MEPLFGAAFVFVASFCKVKIFTTGGTGSHGVDRPDYFVPFSLTRILPFAGASIRPWNFGHWDDLV
jgi:hypothetical protein